MKTLVETAELYIGIFIEHLQDLLSIMVNFMFDAVGVTPDKISDPTNNIPKPTDNIGLSFVDFYTQLLGFLYFDQFQILLVKIFLLTLLSILIMIYAAWHVYGSRITDRFMYSEVAMDKE